MKRWLSRVAKATGLSLLLVFARVAWQPIRESTAHRQPLGHDAPASGLRVTWLGHSSTLVEMDGARILTDPVWSERPSPVRRIGPRRWYPPPLPLDELPAIDAVVISHDHYDHLDRATVVALAARGTRFLSADCGS